MKAPELPNSCMTTEISVRNAAETDAYAIARLTAELGYPVTREAIRRRLERILELNDQLLIVAESRVGVCGWLQAQSMEVIESGSRVEILGLIVTENMRRKGIGKLLVEHAQHWAATRAVEAMVVRTNINRVGSHLFYSAQGYKQTKTQAVYRKAMLLKASPDTGINPTPARPRQGVKRVK